MEYHRSQQTRKQAKPGDRQQKTAPSAWNPKNAMDMAQEILGTRAASRQLRAELQQQQEGVAPESQPMHQLLRSIVPPSPRSQPKPTFRGISHEWGAEASGLVVQPKLTIGAPNDRYEQEADRVAEQVVQRLNAPELERPQASEMVQREVDPEDDDELQMKPLVQRQGEGAVAASDELETSIQQSRGGGQPLPETVREPMEQAFGGVDFSGVKVHEDAQADRLNRSIQAKAFTTGQDIYFRQGAYEPGSRGGKELIAHELTHIVQQNGGGLRGTQAIGPCLSEAKFGAIQRELAEIEATESTTAYCQKIQTSGRTFDEEVLLLYYTVAAKDQKDSTLKNEFKRYAEAKKQNNNDAGLRAAINELVVALKDRYAGLIAAISEFRDLYNDLEISLQAKINEHGFGPGWEDQIIREAANMIHQLALAEDDAKFMLGVWKFNSWVSGLEENGKAYPYTSILTEVQNERQMKPEEAAASGLKQGKVTLLQLRTAAPMGATGGQRYTQEKNFETNYTYHISVSFKIDTDKQNISRRLNEKHVTIENYHVTFTRKDDQREKAYYWWKEGTRLGEFVYSNPAGRGHTSEMEQRARQEVPPLAATLNCIASG